MKRTPLVCVFAILILANLAVFYRVVSHEFVNYDDTFYVFLNPHVRSGLSVENVVAAFMEAPGGLWVPITMVSHVVDSALYGLGSWGHHLSSLLLHISNTLLLFWVLYRMTGAPWRCAWVALLFAVHPMHVEPVAWVSSRKDVLSSLFFFLTIWAYLGYVKNGSRRRWWLVLSLSALGMLAKATLVTLPLVLLLLDYWPLRRIEEGQRKDSIRKSVLSLGHEKLDFIPLILGVVIVVFGVQRSGGGLHGLDAYSLKSALSNVTLGYVGYMQSAIWPANLAVFYPRMEGGIFPPQAMVSLLALVAITLTALAVRVRCPYFLVGWLWYLVTLLPVIGFIPLGDQAMADRYSYLPLIGLFIAVVWGVSDVASRHRHGNAVLGAAAAAAILVLSVTAWLQVGHWRNSVALWQHSLDSTTDNYVARHQLGRAYEMRGRFDAATGEFLVARRFAPHGIVVDSLQRGLNRLWFVDTATLSYIESVDGRENEAGEFGGVASLLQDRKKVCETIRECEDLLRVAPHDLTAEATKQEAVARLQNLEQGLREGLENLRRRPGVAEFHLDRGLKLLRDGKLERAEGHFHEVIRIAPGTPDGYFYVGEALMQRNEFDLAVEFFVEALSRNAGHLKAQQRLAEAEIARRTVPQHR